jgi:RsiW-degrading membrane proteinase PrsW (M82 family)
MESPLKNHFAQILAVLGIVLLLIGLTRIPPLSFSVEAATLILVGGILLTTSFAFYSRISRESENVEKVLVILVCTAIMLMTSALLLYTVVNVEWITKTMAIPHGGGPVEIVIGVIPVVHHIYEMYAASLAVMAIGLILGGTYIRSQM